MMPEVRHPGRLNDGVIRRKLRLAQLLPVAVLVALTVAWVTLPGRAGTWPATLTVVIIALAALCLLELALRGVTISSAVTPATPARLARDAIAILSSVPWVEGFVVAAVALEAAHRVRPWHTAILGIALLACLFAIHLGERGERPGVLRAQLPLIAAGLGLSALAAGASALPGLSAGAGTMVIRVVALASAVLAAGLLIPVWMTRDR